MPLATLSLDALRHRFAALVAPFDTHPDYKRFATSPTHDGGPHIEQQGSTYAYVITERGKEYERRETTDPDEILYWLVSNVTCCVAQQYEARHRKAGVDSRRMWFDLDVKMLAQINPEWGSRKRAEYENTLKSHSFSDDGPNLLAE